MDAALDRIRRGFHIICQGDPLDKLATELGVDNEQLPRLKQGTGDLTKVLDSVYLFKKVLIGKTKQSELDTIEREVIQTTQKQTRS